ncbi:MAG: MFS transporter, partial [Limnohabitans sp.]
MKRAWLVVAAGGVAALQVGKLPPALPALQAELGLSLVQSGFLLSMVQLAGLTLAVFMGLLADGMGLKRSMVRGLLLLALASGAGGLATSVQALLVLRLRPMPSASKPMKTASVSPASWTIDSKK